MIKDNPKNFCGFVLGLFGWTVDRREVLEDKAVVLGVPHTSIMDFLVAYLFARSLGEKVHIMIKKEFFFFPIGIILRSFGCIPVDRSNGATVVRSVVSAAKNTKGRFLLCIAPEGTRKPVHKWKMGYHSIAHNLSCPVYLGFFDWKRKIVSMGDRFEISENARADTDKIQSIYESMDMGAKHPDKYCTK